MDNIQKNALLPKFVKDCNLVMWKEFHRCICCPYYGLILSQALPHRDNIDIIDPNQASIKNTPFTLNNINQSFRTQTSVPARFLGG